LYKERSGYVGKDPGKGRGKGKGGRRAMTGIRWAGMRDFPEMFVSFGGSHSMQFDLEHR
jgi:hypothetical protein